MFKGKGTKKFVTLEKYMKLALQEAEKAYEKGEIPIGAIVVEGDTILARAHNLTETLCDPTAHAEMQVITAACNALNSKYLPQCTIYITVEPCCMCASALYWAQIGKVVYGAGDNKRGCTTSEKSLFHPKTEIVSGILEQEAGDIMKKFFKNLR